MYKHILITTDGSELALQGVDHGLALAAAIGAKVTILTATPPFPVIAGVMGDANYASAEMMQDYDRSQQEIAAQLLAEMVTRAAAQQLVPETIHVPSSGPADAIIRTAKERGCDLICMASHGRRGLKRMLLGSQAAEVVSHSPVPVLIIR